VVACLIMRTGIKSSGGAQCCARCVIVGTTMSGWSTFYSNMRSSLDGCFRPTDTSLSSRAKDTIYYADLRRFDRREMSKYGTEAYKDHVTHYTPCMRSNPENNVSIFTITIYRGFFFIRRCCCRRKSLMSGQM
jgi:hypothetical protein